MGRPREFDERAAVDGAMHAFWRDGYRGTSTEELCAATGLGRSSVYNTFGSKHELFRRALERYFGTGTQAQIDLLGRDGTARERLRALLEVVVEDEMRNRGRGCLVVNTVMELGARDDEVAGLLRRDAERYLAAIERTVADGQRDGEIAAGRDARVLARFVHAQIGGLRVMARSGAGRDAMRDVVEVALAAL